MCLFCIQEKHDLLTKDFVKNILTQSNLVIIRERTIWTIEWFLREKSDDKDAEVFWNYLTSLKSLMQNESKSSAGEEKKVN